MEEVRWGREEDVHLLPDYYAEDHLSGQDFRF